MSADAATEAVAAAAGSILSTVATYPLKTIYTLKALDAKSSGASSAPVDSSGLAIQALRLLKNGSWRFLYAGLKPAVVETAVSSGVYFYLYSLLRQLAVARRRASSGTKSSNISIAESLMIAAVAGAGNMLITCPAQVVATQMQAQHAPSSRNRDHLPPSKGVLGTIKAVYDEGGITGFWKGLLPSLILVVNPAVQYMIYEELLKHRRRHKAKALSLRPDSAVKLDAGEIFATSALAKLGATFATYPMIVVKSRLQAMNKDNADLQYSGTWNAIATIYEQEGVAGFFKGLDTKLLQTVANAALMLMVKEQVYTATRNALKAART
jgi:solute carrier family 25 (peroxisomal adenine nucleotide transporter), member 17